MTALVDRPVAGGPPPVGPAVRPRRRGRPVLVLLLSALAAAGLAWVVGWSPLLGVGTVRVIGPDWMDSDRIVAAAAVEPGTPLARVDVEAVRSRVAALPRVAAVEVRRGWPRELVVVVTPRTPVAAVPSASGWTLVDASGIAYVDVADRPRDLPELAAYGAGRTEAVAVAAGLPEDLRGKVTRISATTPDSVTLSLRSGAQVAWGSAERGDLKARVLVAMLPLQARSYDVSAPDLPTSTSAQRPKGAPRARPAPAGRAQAEPADAAALTDEGSPVEPAGAPSGPPAAEPAPVGPATARGIAMR